MVRFEIVDCGYLTINGVPVGVGVTKAYVDQQDALIRAYTDDAINTIKMGIIWIAPVSAFMSYVPSNPTPGFRLVLSADTSGNTEVVLNAVDPSEYGVYEWNVTVVPNRWDVTVPRDGMTVFVDSVDPLKQEYKMYNTSHSTGIGSWNHFGMMIDHLELKNRGVKTHAEIDTHLGSTTTDPHAGQDLRTTANVNFNAVSANVVYGHNMNATGFFVSNPGYTTLTSTHPDMPIESSNYTILGSDSTSYSVTLPQAAINGTIVRLLLCSGSAVSILVKTPLGFFFQPGAATQCVLYADSPMTLILDNTSGWHFADLYPVAGTNMAMSTTNGRAVMRLDGSVPLNITDGTNSTSLTTGSIVTAGGLAVGGKITAHDLNVTGGADFYTVHCCMAGGDAFSAPTGNINVGGQIKTTSGTDAVSPSTGALVSSGGFGVIKNSYFGGNILLTGSISINSNAFSSSKTSGALVVAGGAGFGGDVYCSNLYLSGAEHIGSFKYVASMGFADDSYMITGRKINGMVFLTVSAKSFDGESAPGVQLTPAGTGGIPSSWNPTEYATQVIQVQHGVSVVFMTVLVSASGVINMTVDGPMGVMSWGRFTIMYGL